jgi:hypothetical protein
MNTLVSYKVEIDVRVKFSLYLNTSSIPNRRTIDSIHKRNYDRILNNRELISAMALYKQCKLQKGGLTLSM